jgi:hypothetical protein
MPGIKGMQFKLSLAGGGTSQGSQPWAVSSPPTASKVKRQFELHPSKVIHPSKLLYQQKK